MIEPVAIPWEILTTGVPAKFPPDIVIVTTSLLATELGVMLVMKGGGSTVKVAALLIPFVVVTVML